MIYSRWGRGSVWYCFWNKSKASMKFKLPTKALKKNQVFQIYDVPSYSVTYGEIKERGISKVLDDISSFYNKHKKRPKEKDMMQLMTYIRYFENNVDKEFTIGTFLYNNWIQAIKDSKYGRIFKRVV